MSYGQTFKRRDGIIVVVDGFVTFFLLFVKFPEAVNTVTHSRDTRIYGQKTEVRYWRHFSSTAVFQHAKRSRRLGMRAFLTRSQRWNSSKYRWVTGVAVSGVSPAPLPPSMLICCDRGCEEGRPWISARILFLLLFNSWVACRSSLLYFFGSWSNISEYFLVYIYIIQNNISADW